MRRDLRTKDIFKHCVKRGWSLHAPDGWVSADQDSMVQETVASALEAFLRRCRAGEGWDPDRGSTLNDYFLGLCRGEFANVFRRWLTSRTRGEAELRTDGGPNALHADEDTARAALARTLLQKIKDTGVLSELQRRLLFGHAYGLTHYELARQYDISSRAVEGHIHRARRQLRKEGITW
jgi:DNA-directed RNA polymerase specialized sigma24 family protein